MTCLVECLHHLAVLLVVGVAEGVAVVDSSAPLDRALLAQRRIVERLALLEALVVGTTVAEGFRLAVATFNGALGHGGISGNGGWDLGSALFRCRAGREDTHRKRPPSRLTDPVQREGTHVHGASRFEAASRKWPSGLADTNERGTPPFVNVLEGGAVTALRGCGQARRCFARRAGGSLAEPRTVEREKVLGATVGSLREPAHAMINTAEWQGERSAPLDPRLSRHSQPTVALCAASGTSSPQLLPWLSGSTFKACETAIPKRARNFAIRSVA